MGPLETFFMPLKKYLKTSIFDAENISFCNSKIFKNKELRGFCFVKNIFYNANLLSLRIS